MVKGSIGAGLTVKAGKENASKDVTSDAYITVENPSDETIHGGCTNVRHHRVRHGDFCNGHHEIPLRESERA